MRNLFSKNNPIQKKLLDDIEILIKESKKTENPKLENKLKIVKEIKTLSENENENNKINKEREECTCLAQRHELINNCTNCGRIVCIKEGSGPCFTCNEIVCTKEEKDILNRNSYKSVKLMEKLTENIKDNLSININKNSYSENNVI